MSSVWLGVVADDVTGATDLASHLVELGVPTVLCVGVPPAAPAVPEGGCLVVALRTRSMPAARAVEESLRAARMLLDAGASRLYTKFCSTFDSTADGNIGPIAAALAGLVGEPVTLLTPSAPGHGRTVYKGQLFVGDVLLHESPMRHHPVNPMTDANLVRWLAAQTSAPVGLLEREALLAGEAADRVRRTAPGTLLVVDAITDDDLAALARLADTIRARLTGGSAGLAQAMARIRGQGSPSPPPSAPDGPYAVVCGSCSAATAEQVAYHRAAHPAYRIDPLRVADGEDVVGEAADFLARHLDRAPLVYAAGGPDEVAAAQRVLGVAQAARLVEQTLAECAARAVALGMRRLLVAGGETSGAVLQRLGVHTVRIGASLDPGVCWSVTTTRPELGLVLKSGNFGSPDLFTRAAHNGR